MMGRARFEDRERRHYRGRFPDVGILDGVGSGNRAGGPLGSTSGGGRKLAILAGYGRSTSSLAVALADADFQVLAFESYEAALEEIRLLAPELVLVGQAEDAVEPMFFLSRVSRAGIDTTIIFLSDHADPDVVTQALEHGAHDVVAPPHSVASILLRLHVSRRTQNRRSRDRDLGRRISLGRLTLDLTTRQVLDGGRPISLSGREFELLVRLVEAGGEVVSREDLMEDIWGAEGTAAVLDATVHRLRKKLDEKLRESDLVNTVRGIGYCLDRESLHPELAGAG